MIGENQHELQRKENIIWVKMIKIGKLIFKVFGRFIFMNELIYYMYMVAKIYA